MQRYLDEKETAYIHVEPSEGREGVVLAPVAVEYQGLLDVEALRLAFKHLFIRHPVFRARIRRDDTGQFILYLPDGCYPTVGVINDEASLIPKGFELVQDITEECARCLIVRGSTRGYVIIAMTHALVDAGSMNLYWTELWNIYTDIVDGRIPNSTPGKLPPSPSSTFHSLSLRLNNRNDKEPKNVKLKNMETVAESPRAQHRTTLLSELETAKFYRFCRAQNVRVTALLAGAMLGLLRDIRSEKGPVPLKLRTSVDPRNNTISATPIKEASWLVWRPVTAFDIDHGEDCVSVARKINRYYDTIVNVRPDPISNWDRSRPDLSIKNAGRTLHNVTTPSGLKLVDIGALPSFVRKFPPNKEFEDRISALVRLMTRTAPSALPTASEDANHIEAITFNNRIKVTLILRGLDTSLQDAFEDRLRSCM